MNKLINEYTGKQNKTLLDIAKFHVIYETIHPFQDGNGRTGRIIMFRESIVNNIVPFIIRDINKAQYINCMNLARYNNDYSSLLQYFSKEQQWYYDKVHEMLI
jgi:Fic family protein